MNKYPDLRQDDSYPKYMKSLGWEIEEFDGNYLYKKKLLFWRFVKIQRPANLICHKLLDHLKKNYRFSTVYIEPINWKHYEQLLEVGFHKNNQPFLPSKTVWIDLSKSEKQLLSEMHHKTRYNIKKFSINNFQFSISKDFEKFADFWQKCARERGMYLSQKKEIIELANAFIDNSVIHLIEEEKKWLAAILRISTEHISYYMYAASTKEGKKKFTPTVVTWEAIKSAKKEGKKIFDFEGIFDERYPLATWKGFTRFKKSFGGEEIEFPGILIKVVI